jgi:hypothetical protein
MDNYYDGNAYDEFITALSKGNAYDEFIKNRDRYLLGNRRLSDIGRPGPQYDSNSPPAGETWRENHPLATGRPGPQYYASNTGGGNRRRGIVLDPNYRGEENLYREPPQEDLNKGLEKFHEGTPAENGPNQNIGDIDEFWRRQAARWFTG